MMLDVNSPLVGESLKADEPWTTYTPKYLNRTFAVVEAFKSYPNTLAFFAGNEVISDTKTSATAPPYVRAVTRDLKNYVAAHSARSIAVGYSAADVRDVLFDSWNYFRCAEPGVTNDMSVADVFALNSYSWCGNSTFQQSGYNSLVDGFKGSNVPVFYSEYGCNQPAPRVFTEVPTIYGSQMIPTFSGGIVYEYSQGINNYGLATINANGSVDLLADYDTLRAQYAGVDFAKVQGVTASKAAVKAPACAASLIKTSTFSSNFTLPTLAGTDATIKSGISPAPSGKIIAITDWTVKATVRDSKGNTLTGLAVKPLGDDVFNTPGTNSATGSIPASTSGSGTGSGSATAPTPSASGKNAAPGKRAMASEALAVAALAIAVGFSATAVWHH